MTAPQSPPNRVGLILGIGAIWLGSVGVSTAFGLFALRWTATTPTPIPPGEDGIFDGVITGLIDGGIAFATLGFAAIGAVATLAALGLAIAAAVRRAPLALPIVTGVECCLAAVGLAAWFTTSAA